MEFISEQKRTWNLLLSLSIFSIGYWLYLTTTLKYNYWISNRPVVLCPRIYWMTTGSEAQVDDWVAVDEGELYYFSAYLDDDKIVVVAIAEKLNTPYNILCRYFDSDGLPLRYSVKGDVLYIPEDHSLRYTATFVYCMLPSDITIRPYAVALLTSECVLPITYVPVRHAQGFVRNFTVCVSPLHLGFDKSNELVEMIELNRILGAQYFIFYNYSGGPNVAEILEHYTHRGLVNVVQWRLPFPVNIVNNTTEEIHYYGQLAAINDCVYKNKGVSSFVVNQDIDEFIIPRKHESWSQMIETLPTKRHNYMFRSSFFGKNWPDTNVSILSIEDCLKAQKYKSITVLKQMRETTVFPAYTRSKWIVKPECIEAAGIHNIHITKADESCKTFVVNVTDALLHHYRSIKEKVDVNRTIDRRMSIFKDKLFNSLRKAWAELGTN